MPLCACACDMLCTRLRLSSAALFLASKTRIAFIFAGFIFIGAFLPIPAAAAVAAFSFFAGEAEEPEEVDDAEDALRLALALLEGNRTEERGSTVGMGPETGGSGPAAVAAARFSFSSAVFAAASPPLSPKWKNRLFSFPFSCG